MIAGGPEGPVEADLREKTWTKLMGNIAGNPGGTLSRAAMAGTRHHRDTREPVIAMMRAAPGHRHRPRSPSPSLIATLRVPFR